ncbi:MAG: hypothetical protein RLZZ117_233 [Cyanobacteriota bacterium]
MKTIPNCCWSWRLRPARVMWSSEENSAMRPMASPPKAWVVPRRSRPGQRGDVAPKSGAGGEVEDYRVAWAFFKKEGIGAGPATKTPTKRQANSSNGRLWQHSIHFELLPLEMVHRVVIQATDRDFQPIGFQLNLHLIKRGAGENTATDGA